MEVERKMAQEENGVLVELLALPLQLGMLVVVVVGRPNLATHLIAITQSSSRSFPNRLCIAWQVSTVFVGDSNEALGVLVEPWRFLWNWGSWLWWWWVYQILRPTLAIVLLEVV